MPTPSYERNGMGSFWLAVFCVGGGSFLAGAIIAVAFLQRNPSQAAIPVGFPMCLVGVGVSLLFVVGGVYHLATLVGGFS
jgi:hypothetical protein